MSRLRLPHAVALATLTSVASLAACMPDDVPSQEEDLDTQAGALIGGTAVAKPLPFVGALGAFDAKDVFQRTCTLTLIAPQWALTSAHCVYNAQSATPFTLPKNARVCANVVNLDDCEPSAAAAVEAAFVHPNWDGHFNHGSDAAVLQLDRALTTEVVQLAKPFFGLALLLPSPEPPPPPCPPAYDAQSPGGGPSLWLTPGAPISPIAPVPLVGLLSLPEKAEIMGFGWASATSTANRRLNVLTSAVLDDDTVHKTWNRVQEQLLPPPLRLEFPDSAWASIFGTETSSTMSACKGDSGGPVFSSNGVQVGIVSAGDPFCSGLVPDLNTDVAAISTWALDCATAKEGCSISVPMP